MDRPEFFVVRIYRRDANDPSRIEGIVEVVASNREVRFANAVELSAILQGTSPAQDPPWQS